MVQPTRRTHEWRRSITGIYVYVYCIIQGEKISDMLTNFFKKNATTSLLLPRDLAPTSLHVHLISPNEWKLRCCCRCVEAHVIHPIHLPCGAQVHRNAFGVQVFQLLFSRLQLLTVGSLRSDGLPEFHTFGF